MADFKSPMLARDFDPNEVIFPVYGSPKIDGIRCVIVCDENGMADPFARSGKIIKNKHIQETIGLSILQEFDGELVVGDAFAPDVYNTTSSGVMSIKGKPDFTFWVFDLYGEGAELYADRMALLVARFRDIKAQYGVHPSVKLLPQTLISSMEELDAFEAEQLALGYEGVMIRKPMTRYKFGRSTVRGGELLKVKRTLQDEAEIIGFEEQMTSMNEAFTDELGRTKRSSAKDGLVPADTLGAFICKNRDKWEPDFSVAPGIMTHGERKELWDNRHAYIGKRITFRHLPHGAKDRPRHGRFYGMRDDDDMSTPCGACDGTGWIEGNQCRVCKATGKAK